jgi:hypothetical protein
VGDIVNGQLEKRNGLAGFGAGLGRKGFWPERR